MSVDTSDLRAANVRATDARALHRRSVWGKVGRYALLTVLAIIVLFPL